MLVPLQWFTEGAAQIELLISYQIFYFYGFKNLRLTNFDLTKSHIVF